MPAAKMGMDELPQSAKQNKARKKNGLPCGKPLNFYP